MRRFVPTGTEWRLFLPEKAVLASGMQYALFAVSIYETCSAKGDKQ